jgi:dihydropteroate synthase
LREIPLFDGRKLPPGRTLVMGILNVTDDSFYEASRAPLAEDAVNRARFMVSSGADIIDVGAESTRPGSAGVSAEREIAALVPVISAIRRELPDTPISADTRKCAVAKAAVEVGADIINDVSGLGLSEEAGPMACFAADSGAAYVLTHTKGTPDVMQNSPYYDDLIPEIRDFFSKKISFLEQAGVQRKRVILDPGLGFGKQVSDNLSILANVQEFFEFELPLLIGASRKGFISKVVGHSSGDPADRLEGTMAISALCASMGVDIIRVHDVEANRRVVDVADAIARFRF